MVTPIRNFNTVDWGSGAYAIAETRDEVLRREIEAAHDGRRLIIRLRRRKRRQRIVDPPNPDEVNYVSALDEMRNKHRVTIQWAPSPG